MATARSLRPQEAAVLQQAFSLLHAGRSEEALALAADLVRRTPCAPDAQHVHAVCLGELGQVDDAVAAFERALALAPGQRMIMSNYATMLRRAGRAHAALGLAAQLAKATPTSAKAWLDLAATAQAADDPAQAYQAALQATRLQPESTAALQAIGRAARALEDTEGATQAFAAAITHSPDALQGWLGLGDVQRRQGRADLALQTYDRAPRSLPTPELHDASAGALLDAGRQEDALALARRITHDYPAYAAGWTTLANLAWEYAEPAVADQDLAHFAEAVAAQPGNLPLRLAFVNFLLSTRQGERALAETQALRALDPHPMLALPEAQALALLGRDRDAEALHVTLRAQGGSHSPRALNAHARHALRMHRPEQVVELALATTRLEPRNQEAWSYLGIAWRLLDDPREHWLCDYERLVGLVEVEPPAGFNDSSEFLTALRAVLDVTHRAKREPMQQSLRGGSQTPGRLFGRDAPVLAQAKDALIHAVEAWIATLPGDSTHPFLARKQPRVRIGGSWSVKLWSEGRHANHIHSEGWMSSAFYVSLPPSMAHGDATELPGALLPDALLPGAIQFGQPPAEVVDGLPPRRIVQPREGRLALFPSYMWHGTIPFQDASPRVTIAFDMVPGDMAR